MCSSDLQHRPRQQGRQAHPADHPHAPAVVRHAHGGEHVERPRRDVEGPDHRDVAGVADERHHGRPQDHQAEHGQDHHEDPERKVFLPSK